MSIIVLGINHKSAPVDVRERLAFDASQATAALNRLKEIEPGAEFVLLSTCNRVELYCACERDAKEMAGRLVAFLSGSQKVEPEQFRSALYFYENEEAVRHLLLVAAGLDSMVVGEAQILGQVKNSYKMATVARSTGKILNRLFHSAFFTAKDVHTNTAISNGRVSVAGVAVELALQLFADIGRARVVVIGAGETGELIVQHLVKAGCTDVTVVNRTYERAAELARRHAIAVGKWEELPEQVGRANILISSVATEDFLFTRDSFEPAIKKRRAGALLIIDVGVPRNFDPAINTIGDVYLYNVDELRKVAEQNLKAREEDITSGLEIVYAGAADFMDWYRVRDIGPLIGRMKDEFQRISRRELERFLAGPRRQASCRAPLEEMVDRVVNKLLHCVIKNVDAVAREAGPAEAAKLVDAIVRQAHGISCATREEGGTRP